MKIKKIFHVTLYLLTAVTFLLIVTWQFRQDILRVYGDLPPFTHSIAYSFTEMVAVRDGVKLHTEVVMPNGEPPFPTVLVRSPYGSIKIVGIEIYCAIPVRYGYACVYQDTRGQGESEGIWTPLVNEINDAKDTLTWLVNQDFQNKNIAMLGDSYLGLTQWAAVAGGLPPEVKTIIPGISSPNLLATMYQDGMFRQEIYTIWGILMNTSHSSMNPFKKGGNYLKAIRHGQQDEVDTLYFGGAIPWYQSWINSPSPNSDFWKIESNVAMKKTPENISIPVLMIGGWHDLFIGSQIVDWGNLATKSSSRFIIGPWAHSKEIGDLNTPNNRKGALQWKEKLNWLDHHLKGKPLINPPGVLSYVMGEDRWVERTDWPPAGETLRWYLNNPSAGYHCDGGSLDDKPMVADTAIYRYDPNNPVPTLGGASLLAYALPGFDDAPAGSVEQGDICDRSDILSFTTEKITEPLRIAGDLKISLTVSSTASDTAFSAKLVEVFESGKTLNIRDGITTIVLTNNASDKRPYLANEKVDVVIKPFPIEWTVKVGSKLRLDISSSDYPKYHRHPNVAGNWASVKTPVIAEQTIYTGVGSSSYLEIGYIKDFD
ncbi:CocE/NonD family hydrolase [Zhongshania aliphaticivorans]|uniref:CocE/NonD family hydrolase n=1 Tax=Zhongshania aliphaticivorans TaxID=1470434 RepID=UPI0012E6BE3F|nr:CocE/NonD family hydrolase [Zhongshania aliphaticivorans]CAA0101351.1 Cocaine esterase [Zhongshania aliphaticivorans]